MKTGLRSVLVHGACGSLVSILLIAASPHTVSAADIGTYYDYGYSLSITQDSIYPGEEFTVVCTAQVTCLVKPPISVGGGTATGSVVAKSNRASVTLVNNYSVSIGAPNKPGETISETIVLSVAFPASAPPGIYNVTGYLKSVKVKVLGVSIDVTNMFPKEEQLGSITLQPKPAPTVEPEPTPTVEPEPTPTEEPQPAPTTTAPPITTRAPPTTYSPEPQPTSQPPLTPTTRPIQPPVTLPGTDLPPSPAPTTTLPANLVPTTITTAPLTSATAVISIPSGPSITPNLPPVTAPPSSRTSLTVNQPAETPTAIATTMLTTTGVPETDNDGFDMMQWVIWPMVIACPAIVTVLIVLLRRRQAKQ